jgi:hypothetical protein
MPNVHPFLDPKVHAALAGLAAAAGQTPAQLAAQLIEVSVDQIENQRTVSNLHRRIDELIGRIERLAEAQLAAGDRAAKIEARGDQVVGWLTELRSNAGPLRKIFDNSHVTVKRTAEILEALTGASAPAKPVSPASPGAPARLEKK